MAKTLPKRDVVIMGLGWTGSILAQELTQAGLRVVAIERGPWRDTSTDFNIAYMQDELRYAIRKDLFLKPSVEAMTMRNDISQTALPMRDYGSFLPGNGVGGAGVHWNGFTWRYYPSDFECKSHHIKRYGAKKIADLQLQDWGVTFDEIEVGKGVSLSRAITNTEVEALALVSGEVDPYHVVPGALVHAGPVAQGVGAEAIVSGLLKRRMPGPGALASRVTGLGSIATSKAA